MEAPPSSATTAPVVPSASAPLHENEQSQVALVGEQPSQQSASTAKRIAVAAEPPRQELQPSAVVQQQMNLATRTAPPKQAPKITRDRYNQQSLGASLNSKVKRSRVLMVGAGGIGCELLKDLVLMGFGQIHIVDLDTIDLSNLNRQFLFRQEHIKKSKALVAKEAAERFNPNVKIVAHHANIKDDQFTVTWFRDFTVVFNALDNLEARRHVNKMCLAANVPLIESGTTGFNGQTQVIKKGITACYDCTPKETPKSFPVCTIRSTPSQPIHCIVWGKSYLLNEIFGASEDQAAFDHSKDAENAKEIEELKRESEALKKIRAAIGTPEFPKMLFDKVFNADIKRLRSVQDMWKSRTPPEALEYDKVLSEASDAIVSRASVLADDQKTWSLQESLAVFNDSLERLSKRVLELNQAKGPSDPEPIITFDKDDIDTLDFVTASANIRSTVFGIESKSRFDVKQMAGNIIPAIATTNAIVAGLCVLESFKVLKGEYDQAKEVFLTPFAPARLLAPDKSRKPNPDCPVCGVFNASIVVDLSRATLSDIVEGFLKENLGLGDREFSVNNDVGILYDFDETNNLPKKLTELGVRNGSFLTIMDDSDEDTLVNIVLDIEEGTLEATEKPYKAVGEDKYNIARKPKATPPETNGISQSNGTVKVEVTKGVKRSIDDGEQQPLKKARIEQDEVVLVEDAGGAIVIDD
ncbi:Molybdenum cofactor biosynthesis, MoeB [Cordyceps fumosorosea ARSEF 2679]|uniref:Ubiquitin-activating enzyme E1-like n=1 Tax=Cordyceps fumosorosea (strain ARSEF 2679) TaxID=1081104 RepID=A0A167VWH7_CORFA|nr:Molybdenum cofactor biosynthesis, MoeB [Cordyceps fumosorosea ARSEF 2679]OAA63056.1 Molybdenum cofactor biosynthesis, MoeB [Cordyceps fumosorosea ARSEF 2679]